MINGISVASRKTELKFGDNLKLGIKTYLFKVDLIFIRLINSLLVFTNCKIDYKLL